ncbi:MAG TPA: hypothetical protein VGF71_02005, partial [Caulobacteraceae bacterium]
MRKPATRRPIKSACDRVRGVFLGTSILSVSSRAGVLNSAGSGDEAEESSGHWVTNSNLGLVFSVVLTGAAFLLVYTHFIYGP